MPRLMYGARMSLAIGLLPFALFACAVPNSGPTGNKNTDSRGAGPDLGGFLDPSADLAIGAAPDLATESQGDLGGDLATSPADLATATGPADMTSAPSGACPGGVTYAGSCAGYVLTYCNTTTNQVVTINCASAGNSCIVNGSGDADCRAPTSGCGPVTTGGMCVGNTLKFCQSNQIVTQDCGFFFDCISSGGYADCY